MPTLAKPTRPKVHRALPRERLFGHLDEARERPVVWVVAPPGAGKTARTAEPERLAGVRGGGGTA
jgi:LuxR family maltose regulon positive regulatory protein